MRLSEFEKKPIHLAPGHRTCQGCPISTIVRHTLRASDKPVVVVNATGCLEVTTTIYPHTSWKVPYLHSAFANSAATMSGVEAAYKAWRKQGKIAHDINFVVFAGDGGTYDIGLQSLSGAIERGHDFLYVCYDNQAYMNTGGQRSSATPYGADTTTTPIGKSHPAGKQIARKDIMKIVAAHGIKYAAQASLYYWQDFYKKAKKGFETEGPAFLNVISPCVPGWKIDTSIAIELSRLAVETRFWPLYEVEDGEYKLNVPVEKPKPLEEFLKKQGRFKHLFEKGGDRILGKMKQEVENKWEELEALSYLEKEA
ncbi:MAG: hypothetical protein ACD_63C00105G0001 [uncultured bacterium]|nr:MAG: hypothetical protein ACD_63C00105G0001 [uncultured bacterium]